MNPNHAPSSHEEPQRLISTFFEGTASPRSFEPLFEHLRDCGDCRHRFEQVRRAQRALSRPSEGLTPHESELLKRQLLAEVAAAETPKAPRWLAWWRTVTVVVPVLATLAMAVAYVHMQPPDDFTAKGGAASGASSLIQVLCLANPDDPAAKVIAVPPSGGACARGSHLMLATPGAPLSGHVAALVVNEDGEDVFYTKSENPKPRELFDGFLTLEKPGALWVIALVTDHPLEEMQARALARAAAQQQAVGDRDGLQVRKLKVEVAP